MSEDITEAYLKWFTDDVDFPFFIQYGKHDTDLYIHSHKDFNELVIVIDGNAVHMVNNEEYTIKKGDVFVVGNDTVHGYKDTDNFRICNIMYRHDEMFSTMPDIAASAGYQALFVLEPQLAKEQSFKSRLKLYRENYTAVKSILDNMVTEYENKPDCAKSMLISQFIQLAVMLSRLYSFDVDRNEHDVINIAKAVSYIENHFDKNISVAKLSELSYYSERHFMRIFKNAYGCSPIEYIIDLRINRACTMLKNLNLTISETAKKCGFDDVNYFSRLFKKKIGMPRLNSGKQYKNGRMMKTRLFSKLKNKSVLFQKDN